MISWVNNAESLGIVNFDLPPGVIASLKRPRLLGRELDPLVLPAGTSVSLSCDMTILDPPTLLDGTHDAPSLVGFLGLYNRGQPSEFFARRNCGVIASAIRDRSPGQYSDNDGNATYAYTAVRADGRAYAAVVSLPAIGSELTSLSPVYSRFVGDSVRYVDFAAPLYTAPVNATLENTSAYAMNVTQFWVGPAVYCAARIRATKTYQSGGEITRLRGGSLFADQQFASRVFDVELQRLTYAQVYAAGGLCELAALGVGTELVVNLQGYVHMPGAPAQLAISGADPLSDGQIIHGIVASGVSFFETVYSADNAAREFRATLKIEELI